MIFDIVEYIIMKWTMPNECRICRICRRVLILKKKESVAGQFAAVKYRSETYWWTRKTEQGRLRGRQVMGDYFFLPPQSEALELQTTSAVGSVGATSPWFCPQYTLPFPCIPPFRASKKWWDTISRTSSLKFISRPKMKWNEMKFKHYSSRNLWNEMNWNVWSTDPRPTEGKWNEVKP